MILQLSNTLVHNWLQKGAYEVQMLSLCVSVCPSDYALKHPQAPIICHLCHAAHVNPTSTYIVLTCMMRS